MRAGICIALLMAAVWTVGAAAGYAEAVPGMFTYQGKLTDASGRSPEDDRYRITFALYPVETGGTAFYTQEAVVITMGGVFTAQIGPVTAAALRPAEVWLEARLAGEEPLPRQRVTAVPYAIRAGDLALPFSGTANHFNPAFTVDQTGTGSAGSFTVHNPASGGTGIYAYTNGTGNALYAFSPGTGDTARFEKSSGSGNAASFYAYGYSNPGSAIRAYGNSQGPVIKATTDYSNAPAGYFKIESTGSTQAALYAETLGTGAGVHAYTGGSSTALKAVSSGSGDAIQATANYGGMALRSTATNGAVAGYFDGSGPAGAPVVAITSTRSGSPALQVSSSGDPVRNAASFFGNVYVSSDLSVSGGISVSGGVTAGPNSVGLPVGYAHFSANGSRLRGTQNLTCTALAEPYTGSYLVDIAGETFTEGSHVVLVTPVTTSATTIAHVWPYNGDIRIAMTYAGSGNAALCGFSILIY